MFVNHGSNFERSFVREKETNDYIEIRFGERRIHQWNHVTKRGLNSDRP